MYDMNYGTITGNGIVQMHACLGWISSQPYRLCLTQNTMILVTVPKYNYVICNSHTLGYVLKYLIYFKLIDIRLQGSTHLHP